MRFRTKISKVSVVGGLLGILVVIILALINHGAIETAESRPGEVVENEFNSVTEKYHLQVFALDGQEVDLDLSEKPALFFTNECSVCENILRDMVKIEKHPYLIATYLQNNSIEKVLDKLADIGLTEEFYYIEESPEEVKEVPLLMWWDGEINYVQGKDAITNKLQIPIIIGSSEISNPSDGGAVNAKLAASLINGTVLQPGEIFSFNRTVGPRSASRGFVEGRSIVENVYGELEVLPDIGGGICRTSTALHLAVLHAGLEVKEHHNHSLPVSYAPQGKDAAVSWNCWDYRFTNNTGTAVKIITEVEDKLLRVQLWQQAVEVN